MFGNKIEIVFVGKQGLGLWLELVFGIGLVLVKPLHCYVLSLANIYVARKTGSSEREE
jgi:hypothetical protein